MEQQIFGGEAQDRRPARPLWPALRNGFLCRCPNCGKGRLFAGFLKSAPECAACGQEFHHHRADDLPAYLVVVIVGHVVVAAFMGVETTSTLSTWQHLAIWVPVTVLMSVALIRPIKGAVIGLQWALYMHGFGDNDDAVESHPEL